MSRRRDRAVSSGENDVATLREGFVTAHNVVATTHKGVVWTHRNVVWTHN
jgi:hypothetical protein